MSKLTLFVGLQWGQWGIQGILDVPTLQQATHLLGFNEPNHQFASHRRP